jgi:DNA polymerase III sliding clamp (beta) subunit (PCNA family)
MQINRTDFISILKKIQPGIDDNSTNINGMDCFIFMDGRIHSHDDAVSISAKTEIEEHFAVSATEFYAILSKFTKEFVEMAIGENSLSLKSGKAKAVILFRKDDVSKRIHDIAPKDDAWIKLPTQFSAMLKALTLKNVPADIQAKIGGVFINGDVMVSSDNFSIIRYRHTSAINRMWLSPRAVALVAKEEVTHYCMQGAWIHFKNDNIRLSCRRLIDEKYPYEQYKAILNSVKPRGISGIFTKDIISVLERATVFAKDKDGDLVVALTFDGKLCTVTSGGGVGSFEEETNVTSSTDIPIRICLSVTRLKQVLAKWEEIAFYLGETSGDNPLLVFTKDSYMEILCLDKE